MRTSNMMQTKNWMALVGLTCAAFIFNTSEFIPIGLLTDIANDFLTTEAQAGMIISIYAFVVMLLSLPLMIVVSRFEMKKLLYNPQIQISVVSGTKRSIFRQKNKTKRSKKRLHTTLIKPEQKVNEDLCSGFIVS